MSASAASSRFAAILRPFSSIWSTACTTALPAIMAGREATEAKPAMSSLVSPCWWRTRSGSMPSRSAAGRGSTDGWPWLVDCTTRPHARDVVHAVEAAREVVGLDVGAERAEKPADAGKVANSQREKSTVLVKRKFRFRHRVPRLVVAQEGFPAGRHPMDRPADPAGDDQQDGIFRIERGLHAEGAADVVGQHAQLLALETHDGQQRIAHGAHALRAHPQGVAVGRRVVARAGAARLHA